MIRAGVQPPKQVKEVRTGTKGECDPRKSKVPLSLCMAFFFSAPGAAPQNVRVPDTTERTATFTWEPPPCDQQNGEITQYEYNLSGVDDWAVVSHSSCILCSLYLIMAPFPG